MVTIKGERGRDIEVQDVRSGDRMVRFILKPSLARVPGSVEPEKPVLVEMDPADCEIFETALRVSRQTISKARK